MAEVTSKSEPRSIGPRPETSQLRNRRQAHVRPDVLIQSKGSEQIPCYTSKMNFPRIPDSLQEYGLALMELDSVCLKAFTPEVRFLWSHILESKFIDQPIPTEFKLLDNAGPQSQQILDQFHEVSMGRQQLNMFYLGDSYVIKFWKLALDMYSISNLIIAADMGKVVETLEHGVTKVAKALLDAAKKETLSRECEATIRERWILLDLLLCDASNALSLLGIKKPKRVFTWPYLEEQMKIIAANKRCPVFHCNPAAAKSPQASPKSATVLWSTFTIVLGVGMPMVAKGFLCSPHRHGTLADADFWFLIQSSSMNVLAIFTMALPLLNRRILWIPMAVAVICALVAPLFYISFDTEWSALMSMFAGAIQAFITMQITLIAHEGGF